MLKPVYAQITNPALRKFNTPDQAGAGFAYYAAQLWKTVIVVGGIAFLLYLIWGGLEWITAGGEKTKIENAQRKITSGLTGLIVLVGSFAIISFIEKAFGINILKVNWTFE